MQKNFNHSVYISGYLRAEKLRKWCVEQFEDDDERWVVKFHKFWPDSSLDQFRFEFRDEADAVWFSLNKL